MIHFRQPIQGIERPQMEADVVIIGGGPAGMACALRLSQLIDAHNDQLALQGLYRFRPLSKENIYVLEKAREAGPALPVRSAAGPPLHARAAARF